MAGTEALPASAGSIDPDDYSSGFALWSGTSFSAPLLRRPGRPAAPGLDRSRRTTGGRRPWTAAGRPCQADDAGATGLTRIRHDGVVPTAAAAAPSRHGRQCDAGRLRARARPAGAGAADHRRPRPRSPGSTCPSPTSTPRQAPSTRECDRCDALVADERALAPETRGLVWAQLALIRQRTAARRPRAGRLFSTAIPLLDGRPGGGGPRPAQPRQRVHLRRGNATRPPSLDLTEAGASS